MAFEVVCVNKDSSSRYNDCRCITQIGYEVLGSVYKKTPEEVHDKIKDGKDFYVEYNGKRTDLVAAERGSTKYVRTEPNDTKNDNLLKQDSCFRY